MIHVVDDMKHGSLSMADIEETLDLVVNKKWPDDKHTPEQHYLWTILRIKLGIRY